MATYLQGVTDYIPNIQPWKPNYNFYQNALERKQAQYDRGWEQTNNVYSSILNAPMMRGQNIERRDNFFKSVENQIEQMSGVDLSLQQNVDQATQIFKPFYEDDNIVKDIGFTKKYQTEMQHAEYLRNCTDKDKCGNKYWDGGVRLMNHIAQDFVNASDEEALRINAPRYTNYANLMDKASEKIKSLGGWKMEYQAKEGRYMVKRTNGEQAVVPLMNFMMANFGDDPELTAFYGAKAALKRYEDPTGAINEYEKAMLKSKAQSPEELEQLLKDKNDQTNFEKASKVIQETKNNVKAGADRLFLQKETLEQQIQNEGIIEGSPEDLAYRQILDKEDSAVGALESVDEIANMVGNMQYIDSEGNVISKGALDGVVANAMMMRDMGLAAQTIAYKDYSVTKKADEFALADYKSQIRMKEAAINHNYELETENVKSILKQGDDYRKFLIDRGYINPFTGDPKYVDPSTQTMPILPGGGMATGDPADIAAALRQRIASGTPLKASSEDSSYLYSNAGFKYKPSKGDPKKPRIVEAMNEPDVFMSGNLQTGLANFPNVLKPGIPQGPMTGKVGEGVLKLDYQNVRADDRISKIIAEGENGNIDGAMVNYKFQQFLQPVKNIITNWEQLTADNQGFIVGSQLNSILNIAASTTDPDKGYALDGAIGIGNMIKQNLENPAIKAELIKNGSYELLKDFPNSNNTKNLDNKYFRKLVDKGLTEDIMLAAGKRDLFTKFTNNQGQQIVQQYNSTDMIDLSSVDLISKDEADDLRKRNDFSPMKPLSPDEAEALKMYDYYNTQPTYDNDFRSVGLNSPIPALRDFNNNQLTQMALTENMYKAAQNSKRNYNNQMTAAANTMAESFKNENADFASKMLAENMITVGKDGWAKLNPLGHVYNKAAEKATMPGGDYTDFVPTNWLDIVNTFSSTIPELEEEYMGGARGFSNNAIKNMLWSSELAIDKAPPRNLNREALWSKVDVNKFNESTGGALEIWGFDKETLMNSDAATFTALLKEPSTQVVRNKDNTISINSPYISGNIKQTYKLDEIEMNRGFEKMFDKIEDKSGTMRSEYLNMAQNTKGKKMSETLMFPQVAGQSPGNWNYAVPAARDIVAQAGNHTQEAAMVTEALNEVSQKYSQDLSRFGVEQGSKETLDLILSEMNDPVKKYDEDNLMIIVDVEPVSGNMELSKVTVNMHPKTKHKYLKQKGQLVYDSKTDALDEKWVSLVEDKATYYIPNAQARLIKNTQPDPYYTLAGLSDGEGYVDDIFWDEFGGKVEYKRVGDKVQVIPTYKIKDPETGKMREVRMIGPDGPIELPLTGVNWKQQFELQYQNIYQLPFKNLEADANLDRITSLDYYKK